MPVEVRGAAWVAADEVARRARERLRGAFVAGRRSTQQVLGHALGGLAGLDQRCRELLVQAPPHGQRHVLVERISHQLVPERDPFALLGEHARTLRGPQRGDELRHRPPRQHGEVAGGEADPEHGREAEQLELLGSQEAEAVQDRHGERRHGLGDRHVSRPVADHDGAVRQQRGHQLADEQRVPGRALRLRDQALARTRPEELLQQRRGRQFVQRPDRDGRRVARREQAEQSLQLRPSRLRPGTDDQRDRQLVDTRRDPREHPERGRIGPVQVLDREHDRRVRAQLVEQLEHGLGDAELPLGGRVRPGLPRTQVRVHPLAPGLRDAVDDRREWAIRVQLLGPRGQHLGAGGAGFVERRVDEPGLADPRLALDDGEPPAAAHCAHERDEGR